MGSAVSYPQKGSIMLGGMPSASRVALPIRLSIRLDLLGQPAALLFVFRLVAELGASASSGGKTSLRIREISMDFFTPSSRKNSIFGV